jgi:acetylglutamate kinase
VSVVVLKIGGASTAGAAETVAELRALGHQMERRGIEVRFVHGRRVTTAEGLEVVRESLEAVNAAICAAIGPDAVGLAGDEVGLLAEPMPGLGLVGSPLPSRPEAVANALAAGFVPVVSPLARGPLNVNADEAASALAVGLGAQRIMFLTDVPGVFQDGRLLRSIAASKAELLVGQGTFEGGIVPKLLAAAGAARNGLVAEIGATAVVA